MKKITALTFLIISLVLATLTKTMAYNCSSKDKTSTIGVGTDFTAVVDEIGSLWMWGSCEDTILRNGTTENSIEPIKVMDNVLSISTGNYTVAAIDKNSSLWMWG